MDYEKKYKEALEIVKAYYNRTCFSSIINSQEEKETLERAFPELKESGDEGIRDAIKLAVSQYISAEHCYVGDIQKGEIITWLEEHKGQEPKMIQWTGKNLKEVIDFTGKSPRFDEWFKSWEDFENYVHSHEDIFKLFCEDGSHYEVPVGSWIVKTPDGFNVPSLFKFVQKPAEWNKDDELYFQNLIMAVDSTFSGGNTKNWLQNRFKSLCPQPKQEWGKEEMKVLDSIIDDYENAAKSFGGYDGKIMLLKAIRDGEYDLSKQLWSEEDEKFINDLCNLLASLAKNNRIGCYYAPDIINKIKNLRTRAITYALDAPLGYDKDMNPIYPPINHWKPSEEQMGALEHFIRSWGESGTMSPQNPILCAAKSLYNELKKL